jgi:hypothetical protein
VVTTEEGYEVRYEEQLLATLGDPQFSPEVECVTRDGSWRFIRLKRGNAQALDGTAVVASYLSNLFPGGTIELTDSSRFRLRPPLPWTETWKLRRGRELVVALRLEKVVFGPAAREVYQLPLLTLFAFHSMLIEYSRQSGGGGGDGGGGGF